ncbi:MAG: short-chain dehydrogenase/reductase, partial [Mycobacterium sp.]
PIPAAYADTVGAMNTVARQSGAGAAGDPDRAAQILVEMAYRNNIPDHLPLGVNAAEGSIHADRQLLNDDLTWRLVSRSADYTEPYPVPFPPDPID